MTVFTGKQIFPIDYQTEVSQKLVDASHSNDLKLADECISDPYVDVNFTGTVVLKTRRTEITLRDESAHEVFVEYEEFKTEVTALFLAAHNGNSSLVKKLLSGGAYVNQALFRGHATTAATREGHFEVLQVLLSAGASQLACEEALLEASYHGRARASQLLMESVEYTCRVESDMIRPHVAVHALVSACCRGFVEVVDTLLKSGVDANAIDRVLLQSSKPFLHANVDCNALVAAVVSRQVSVVRLLLKAAVRMDIKMRLGAWSWDLITGEEFRVGAGLAEPYSITWCAVEYYESSGSILQMLLQHQSPNTPHIGRTLVHHAILCNNPRALDVLINSGADVQIPLKTTVIPNVFPIHLAARLGYSDVLNRLLVSDCNLDSRTDSGETALMVCVRNKQVECLQILVTAGADLGLVNLSGQSVISIAGSNRFTPALEQTLLRAIRSGKVPFSSNIVIFSSLLFVTQSNDITALVKLIERPDLDLNGQDKNGYTAAMLAASKGHVEAFRLLVYAGADITQRNKNDETAITLSERSKKRELFEKVMLEYALEKGNHGSPGFYPLHCAARRGDTATILLLMNRGYEANVFDSDGYTPLMLAARGGHGSTCEVLIGSCNAKCDVTNKRGDTALSLARKNGVKNNESERVIMDELARKLVLGGENLMKKHTKKGKGPVHRKTVSMVSGAGVLRWGKSSKRNVICKEAETGPSSGFRWNRRNKFDADEPGLFHVVTTKNKEVHFVCNGGREMAQLWVRGIKLVSTRDASIFHQKSK